MSAIALFWGINWPTMKIALAGVPPWSFRTVCLSAGGLGLLAIARLSGASLKIPRDRWGWLALASLTNITGWHLGTAFGLLTIGGGRAAILAFTMPLWATLIAMVALGDRPTFRRWLGLAAGMAGMAVLLLPETTRLGGAPVGALLVLLAAMSWATGTVIVKAVDWRTTLPTLLGWQQLLGGIPIALGWLVFEHGWFDFADVPRASVIATVYCALIPMVFCYWAYFRVVTLLPASVATLGTLATPVVGVFSSAWVLGERIGPAEILALVLVVLALGLVLLPSRRSHGIRPGARSAMRA
jgi:drug/metabolite transporter (DMT)-like permease